MKRIENMDDAAKEINRLQAICHDQFNELTGLGKKLDQALDLMDVNERAWLMEEWTESKSPQRP